MNFSAWFEVYLGDRWYTFDARHNKPRIGRILMARGRDATDVPGPWVPVCPMRKRIKSLLSFSCHDSSHPRVARWGVGGCGVQKISLSGVVSRFLFHLWRVRL